MVFIFYIVLKRVFFKRNDDFNKNVSTILKMLVVYDKRVEKTHMENTTHLVLRHLNYSKMNHSLLMTGTFPVQITNHNQSINLNYYH